MKSQVIDLLKSSVNDVRSYSSVLSIEKVMTRHDPRGAAESRFTNVETGELITSIEDLMTAITVENTRVEPYNQGMRNYTTASQLLLVTSDNIKFSFDKYCIEDEPFINMFGINTNRLSFILGYVNDADEVQPLKILGTILTEV